MSSIDLLSSMDLCCCGSPLVVFPLPVESGPFSGFATDFHLLGCPNPDCGAVYVSCSRGVRTLRPSTGKLWMVKGVTFKEVVAAYQAIDPAFEARLPKPGEDVTKLLKAFLRFDTSKLRLPEKVGWAFLEIQGIAPERDILPAR